MYSPFARVLIVMVPPVGDHRLDRIRHQIEKDLLELIGVAEHSRQVMGKVLLDHHVGLAGEAVREQHNVLYDAVQVGPYQRRLARPAEVEQGLDDLVQAIDLLLDDLRRLLDASARRTARPPATEPTPG